jgi:hypothetical protein
VKKILKWVAIVGGPLLAVLFLAFLYFIPPFMVAPPEAFIAPNTAQGPSLDDIKDPAERLLAERGKYIVLRTDCNGCHTSIGDKGPKWDEYLAGGAKGIYAEDGMETYCRNLTSDAATGLARRTDDQVKRVLRSGVLPEGRQSHWRRMPWVFLSLWTEEDRHAVVVYLRHVKPVYHEIPDARPVPTADGSGMIETAYGRDSAGHEKGK